MSAMLPAACLAVLAALVPTFAAAAAGDAPDDDARREPPLWSVGAGRSGFREAPVAGLLAVTYHHRPLVGPVRPLAGALASGDGSAFVYGGLSCDLELPSGLGATPILTAGYYERGGGMNLGGAFEFRSGFEVYHRVGSFSRVGLSIHHISNAGLYDRNPGQETLFLSYGVAR
jgi:hypothetical protein